MNNPGYHADPAINATTIRHSGQAGLWLYDSQANALNQNAIIQNDDNNNTSRAGVEILSGSDVAMLPQIENEIANNAYDQMKVDASSSLNMGIASYQEPGWNSVYGGAGDWIYNQGTTTVDAYGNWWGTTSSLSYLFTGPVDYSGYLTYDPCSSGCGVASTSYPQQTAPSRPVRLVTTGSARPAQTGSVQPGAANPPAQATDWSDPSTWRTRIHALQDHIARADNAPALMNPDYSPRNLVVDKAKLE